MRKSLFRVVAALSLTVVCAGATVRAQTVMEWMTLSIVSSYTSSAASSPATQAQCGAFGWLDLRVGPQLYMPCILGDSDTPSVNGFEPQPIEAVSGP